MKIDNAQRIQMTVELCAMYRAGQRDAGDALLRMHQGLVTFFVDRRIRRSRKYESWRSDMRQEATLGLLRAAEKWDPALGSWGNYASLWIRQFVGRFVENIARDPVRTPVNVLRDRRNGKSAYFVSRSFSIDAPLGAAAEFTPLDVMFDEEAPLADDELDESTVPVLCRRVCELALATLTRRERDIIRARFWDDRTLLEIGVVFGVSRERIRQIEVDAIMKIRAWLHRNGWPREPGRSFLSDLAECSLRLGFRPNRDGAHVAVDHGDELA